MDDVRLKAQATALAYWEHLGEAADRLTPAIKDFVLATFVSGFMSGRSYTLTGKTATELGLIKKGGQNGEAQNH